MSNNEELNKAIDYSQYADSIPDFNDEDETDDNSFWGLQDPKKPGQVPQEQPKTASRGIEPSSRRSDPLSDEEISRLKTLAPLWLKNLDVQRKHEADAKKNPILSAEGHKHRQVSEMMKDYHDKFAEKAGSDDYKEAGHFNKLRAQLEHKQNWHKDNPGHHEDVMNKLDQTKDMYGIANKAYLNERKEQLQDMLKPGAGAMSAKEAAAHFGTKEGGEDDMPTVSTVSSASASFGHKNPELVQQHLDKLKDLEGMSPEDEEKLQSKGAKAPLLQHPAFQDPDNKKLVNDFYSLHGKAMRDDTIRKQMKSLGIDEGLHQHIDMGRLADSAMTGMLKAANDYAADRGPSFGTYVNRTANNHVRTELQRQHTIAQSLRSKAKQNQKDASVVKPADAATMPGAPAPAPVKTFSPEEKAALQAKYASQGKTKLNPMKPDISAKMPNEMKERHQSIVAAKKTQGDE